MPQSVRELGEAVIPFFQHSCDQHDVCWENCGETQDSCDTEFLNNMLSACGLAALDAANNGEIFFMEICELQANILHQAVNSFVSGLMVYSQVKEEAGCPDNQFDCLDIVGRLWEYFGNNILADVSL